MIFFQKYSGWLIFAVFVVAGCHSSKVTPPEGMVAVPAGEFIMGSNRIDKEGISAEFGMRRPMFADEHPEHKVNLPLYFIDQIEVTNAQYKLFVDATRSMSPRGWPNGMFPFKRANYPVTTISWYDASRFCEWQKKRLPTEAEWEKAARGTDGREYPWGNEYQKDFANMGDSGIGDLTPVGSYEKGKSPYGAYDMTGNVWEWTSDWYLPYSGTEYKSEDFGEKNKVLRGGSYGGVGHYTLKYFYRTSYRFFSEPQSSFQDVGFRCARTPGS
ncbi:MAG: formylglycine-generating enzyme family protein [Nitrospiria bacterium]